MTDHRHPSPARPSPRSSGKSPLAVAAVLVVAALTSACGGPPSAPVTSSLVPGRSDTTTRGRGAFAVVFAGPRGEARDLAEPAVTVLFNRAMRDADSPDGEGLPALRLEASDGLKVAGTWRWVGTHGLLFLPDGHLRGSSHFHVVVPAGTRALDGSSLVADYAFDFETPRPHVILAEPEGGASDVRPDASFKLVFDQPMLPSALEAAAHLRVRPAPDAPAVSVALTVAHAKGGKFPEQTLVLTPKQRLPTDSAVELVLDAGLTGEGLLATRLPETLRYRTYGPLLLSAVQCPRVHGNEPRCEAHRDFTIVLSNAVDPAEFKAHLRVPNLRFVPPPTGSAVSHKRRPPTKELVVSADPDFGKRYQVTLTRGLHDVFGQTLDRDLTVEVDTEAPWSPGPKSTGATAGKDAVDDDASPDRREREPLRDPGAPHRPRLEYGLTLGLSGHVVEALASQGVKSHQIPVGDVNVATYGLFARALDEDRALDWLDRGGTLAGPPGGGGWRFDWISPHVAENVRDVRTVDLDVLLAGPARGGRGAALLALNVGGAAPEETRLVTVTDLGISAEVSRFGSSVWVTRLSSGAPVAGATVTVRGGTSAELPTVVTDSDGVASFAGVDLTDHAGSRRSRHAAYFFVRSADDWTYAKVERASASYGTGIDLDLEARAEWAGMIYTDRGVYRPGETLKLGGVFRKVDARGVAIVPDQDARVLVEDVQGEKVFDGRAKLGAFGELALDVPLPKSSHLGNATIKVELGRKDSQSFSESVVLAAYKASEFKVAVDAERDAYVRGDDASVSVHAEYLFGAPMAEAKYRVAVLRRAAPFVPPKSSGFETSDTLFVLDHPEARPTASALKDQEGSLNATGRASVSFPLSFQDMTGPEQVTMEAEVTDVSHESVARRASVWLHPAAFYLGIGEVPSRFVAVGATVPVKLVAFDPKGGHVPAVAAKVELIERTWTTATIDEAADVPRKTSRVHDEVVAACEAQTSVDVVACPLRVPRAGYFILRASAKDARGNRTGASASLYALSDRSDQAISWAAPAQGRRLQLETDRHVYKAGETAKVLIQNPFKEADAWVTVERGGILDERVIAIRGPMPTVDIRVKPEYFPNAFVTVRVVRGRVADAPSHGADVGAPDFRLGVIPIAVDAASHRLTLTLSTPRKEYRPAEEVEADVFVKGADGRPAQAEVTFFAADEGVLMLTGYETPDPLPAFSGDRKLAVFSVESREDLAHLLPLKNGERVRPLGFEYFSSRGADKGADGGGGGDGSRFDFKTTAYFDSGRSTDAEGRVRFHFKLPDNLTTFRLMAVVAGADDRFGSGETSIVTSKKLMARPVMPRLVRVGDKFDAGVIVTAKDLPATTAHVTVKATGVDVLGAPTREVAVPKGGSVEVRFPFVATASGTATFSFAADVAGSSDAVRVSREVEQPVSVETTSAYGETSGAVAVQLGDFSGVQKEQGGLDVHVASTALVGLATGFDRLFEYPYGCTEQLVSRILPLLVLPDLARAVGARLPAHAADALDDGIGKLLEHQDEAGGFTFWGQAGDERPVPWLSAYATLAVEGAAQKGLFVPRDARDRSVSYLRHLLDTGTVAEDDDTQADPDVDEGLVGVRRATGGSLTSAEKRARSYADLVFAADTLSSVGQPDPASMDRLFEARARRPLFTQALLLHGMAVGHRPSSQLDALVGEIVERVRVDANVAFADESLAGFDDYLGSSTRTSALVLRALVAARPDHPLAAALARGLLARRTDGAWRSTQENVWALLALDAYRRAQESAPPQFDARIFLGGGLVGAARFHGDGSSEEAFFVPTAKVAAIAPSTLTFEVRGQGKLYYSAELRTASSALPEKARDSGLFVQRLVRAVKPEELGAALKSLPHHGDTRVPVGELVLVDVLLESAEPREQVLVDDPLPAGLEPVDFALETAARSTVVDDEQTRGLKPRRAMFDYGLAFGTPAGMHREQHDDRVLTFVSHLDPGIYHFRYLARATTPGDFVVPPTQASCLYSPEVSGASRATRFVVTSTGASPAAAGAIAKAP